MAFDDVSGQEGGECLQAKRSAMPKNEASESLELLYAEICEYSGLVAFVAFNANADVSCLDHVDVVASISDCDCECIGLVLLHEFYDLCFLVWAASEHHY